MIQYTKKINWILLLKIAIIVITTVIILGTILNIIYTFGFVDWKWLDYYSPEIRKIWPGGIYLIAIGQVICLYLLYYKCRSMAWGLFVGLGAIGLFVLTVLALALKQKSIDTVANAKTSLIKRIFSVLLYLLIIAMIILPFINIYSIQRLWQRLNIYFSDNNQLTNNIDRELNLVKSNYALIIQSQGVDEYPLWSEDGKFIYAQIEGTWIKINLEKVHLNPGTWRGGMPIGVNDNLSSLELAKEDQKYIDLLVEKNKYDAQYVTLSDGTKLGFEEPGFYSQFVIIRPDKKPEILWETDGELCYYLILSPNKKYLLFKCELNGIILMNLENYQK